MCFTQVGFKLTFKHYIGWKGSSLLRKSVNYVRNKFYDTGPWVQVTEAYKHSSLLRYELSMAVKFL
jgi:hypothetical protein